MALESDSWSADAVTRTTNISGISGWSKGPGLLTFSPGIHCDVQKLFSLSEGFGAICFPRIPVTGKSPTNRLEDQWPACPSSPRPWNGASVVLPAFFLVLVLHTRVAWECGPHPFDVHGQFTADVSAVILLQVRGKSSESLEHFFPQHTFCL